MLYQVSEAKTGRPKMLVGRCRPAHNVRDKAFSENVQSIDPKDTAALEKSWETPQNSRRPNNVADVHPK